MFNLPNVKAIVVPTEKLKEYLVSKIGVKSCKVYVNPFGVDIKKFIIKPFPKTPTILYSGATYNWKIKTLRNNLSEMYGRIIKNYGEKYRIKILQKM